GSAACRAAVAANGAPFTAWDNLRVPGVNGADRQRVPDGKLCSGGLPAYRGLDLTRADWPATRVAPGGTLPMTYVSTIPHAGTFRMYLTKPGYDPAGPLTWSDLPRQPFAQVTDPALTNGAYRFRVTLPSDRTGRHVLYTIWQNSSTPDTYYSCSDVVFPERGQGARKEREPEQERGPAQEREARREPAVSTDDGAAARSPAPETSPVPRARDEGSISTPVAADGTGSGSYARVLAGGAAAVLVLTGAAVLAVRLRRH
ncbi:lytic polysaccharide monooxygenase, partial [Streptomyces sp. 15-116A]|uniref:lytic polysaccharide monooxygenase n=1 Tax=Streptomyces sp. 15-116A TaxID=2259035 RepID=UPI0021B165AB